MVGGKLAVDDEVVMKGNRGEWLGLKVRQLV